MRAVVSWRDAICLGRSMTAHNMVHEMHLQEQRGNEMHSDFLDTTSKVDAVLWCQTSQNHIAPLPPPPSPGYLWRDALV